MAKDSETKESQKDLRTKGASCQEKIGQSQDFQILKKNKNQEFQEGN